MSNFKESTIEFEANGEPHSFKIYNDLPEFFGHSIEEAANSWLFRTNDFSPESLVSYILSKDTGVICMTEREYLELNKES